MRFHLIGNLINCVTFRQPLYIDKTQQFPELLQRSLPRATENQIQDVSNYLHLFWRNYCRKYKLSIIFQPFCACVCKNSWIKIILNVALKQQFNKKSKVSKVDRSVISCGWPNLFHFFSFFTAVMLKSAKDLGEMPCFQDVQKETSEGWVEKSWLGKY